MKCGSANKRKLSFKGNTAHAPLMVCHTGFFANASAYFKCRATRPKHLHSTASGCVA